MKNSLTQIRFLTAGIAAATLAFSSVAAQACTAFEFNYAGHAIVAKNHDFMMGEGLVVVNHRGIAKRSARWERPIEWVSRFGSVTYNQFGREMPIAGMNEAGLVVEMLWLNETLYAAPDDRKELDVLQWIQYQLDTARTVEDVVASDRSLRIADGPGRCHFFIADQKGHTAVLELLNGRLQVHTGADLPVRALANDTYSSCLTAFEAQSAVSKTKVTSTSAAPPSFNRFQTVAARVPRFDMKRETPVDFAFATLERVRNPQYTQFQLVYDTEKLRIFLRRQVDDATREINFSIFDFSPSAPVLAADLTKPGPLAWQTCTAELNRSVMRKSYAKVPFLQQVTAEEIDAMAAMPENFRPAPGS